MINSFLLRLTLDLPVLQHSKCLSHVFLSFSRFLSPVTLGLDLLQGSLLNLCLTMIFLSFFCCLRPRVNPWLCYGHSSLHVNGGKLWFYSVLYFGTLYSDLSLVNGLTLALVFHSSTDTLPMVLFNIHITSTLLLLSPLPKVYAI